MNLPDGLRRALNRLAGRRESVEDERLIALFRNRAELKKELNALDDERHRLLDRLKLQEGATMRVEEQLEALEQYLGRPEQGYACLAHFQLKAVWRAAAHRLHDFAEELARQQKDRERKQQLAEFDRDRRVRVAEVDRELVEARVLADQLQAEQRLAHQRLAAATGFWNYFRRRRLLEEIEIRGQRIEAALTQVTDLSDRRHAIESEPAPLYDGMSLEGRRAVNLAVIACAESLLSRLDGGGFADRVRQSTLRRVQESSYGTREDCLALVQRTSRAIAELEGLQDDLADIKARTDRLRRSVTYRNESDVVPAQESIAPVAGSSAAQGLAPPAPNVLLDEYWEIYKALVR